MDPSDSLAADDADIEMTQLQDLHSWLTTVHNRAPEAPLMVIGTHARAVPEAVKEERVQRVESSFEGQVFRSQLVEGLEGGLVTCVDSKDDDDAVFERLRGKLMEVQAELPEFKEQVEVPLKWMWCLDELKRHSASCTRAEVHEIAAQCQMGAQTNLEEEVALMLELLNNLGLLIHFDHPALRELVVMKPQWLLNLMRDLVCRRNMRRLLMVLCFSEQVRVALGELFNRGRLDADTLLPLLWPEITDEAQCARLLQYMHHFELCYPLEGDDAGIWQVPSVYDEAQASNFWGAVGCARTDRRAAETVTGTRSIGDTIATSLKVHGDWEVEVPAHIPDDLWNVTEIAKQDVTGFTAAIARLPSSWAERLLTSVVTTLPHGLKLSPDNPAHLRANLRAACQVAQLRVLHQSCPSAAWTCTNERVELSADGLQATLTVHSFCRRALVDAEVLELQPMAGPTLTSTMPGGLPAPSVCEFSDEDLAALDALEFPEAEAEAVPPAQLPAFVSAYAPRSVQPDDR
eukprot:COSAG01_NODE_6596_length_3588_cov_1.782459_3_plen_516_part_01